LQSISIVGLIGISLTIFASLYYAPAEEYTDSYGERQYHELGNNARYGSSIGLWILGLLLIGCWFHFTKKKNSSTVAMVMAIFGQLIVWIIVHGVLIGWFNINEIYGGIFFVLILWTLSIVLVFKNTRRVSKLSRKSFSKYVKDEILERQQNRCAICNAKLFYCHFDHIDGNRSNNSLGNCQALCANCHDLKTRRDQRKNRL
jgi:hypothetical protein